MIALTPVESLTKPRLTGKSGILLPWIYAALGGILLSLAFPNEIIPGWAGEHPPFIIGWIALFPLMLLIYALPARKALWTSWFFGFFFFFSVLSWLRLFNFLPWLLLSLALSLTFPLIVLIAQKMPFPAWLSPLGLAISWVGIEWLRSQGIFGFSWAEIGFSQAEGIPAYIASLGSVHLISFLMIWFTGTTTLWLLKRKMPKWLLPVMSAVLLVCLAAGWQQTRLSMARWRAGSHSQVFSLVQPSIQKNLTPKALVTDISSDELTRRLNYTLSLSRQSMNENNSLPSDSPPLVVLSESAINFPPDRIPTISSFCRKEQCKLLTGAPAFLPPGLEPRNSAYVFSDKGEIIGRYDKIHLVPFGEFVPFRQAVEFLRAKSMIPDVRNNDIKPGTDWTPLEIDGHLLGIGICFESTFPSIARRYANQGANYLVFITNDAWFHQTAAVRQHFNHSRFRAIESGLPVVRVAGTGISGIISPEGDIIDEIPTYSSDTRVMRLSEGVPGTFYTAAGWLFAPFCLVASLLVLFIHVIISLRKSSL